MAATIIGPVETPATPSVCPAVIHVRENWSDDWLFEPRLELVRARVAAAGQDLSSATFRHRYAPTIKQPWESSGGEETAWPSLAGWWVRVALAGDDGYQTAWLGRISSETRQLIGSQNGPAGDQIYTAYGPEQILRKRAVSRSWWIEQGRLVELGWVPPINGLFTEDRLFVTRSAVQVGGSFVHGGPVWGDQWDYAEFIDYLLARFVDETATGGPRWTLGQGRDHITKDPDMRCHEDVVRFGTTQTVAEILGRLISPRRGIDYKVLATDDGFEIAVFALHSRRFQFAAATMEPNPHTVEIRASETADNLRTTVVRSADQRYGTIRILGRRIVAVDTLRAEKAMEWFNAAAGENWEADLEPGWSVDGALETAYKAGTGDAENSSLAEHDDARRDPKYRTVYQTFTKTLRRGIAAPQLDAEGGLVRPGVRPGWQHHVWKTLPWTPLQTGFDYTVDPPVDHNPAGTEPALLPPAVWLYFRGFYYEDPDTGQRVQFTRWVSAEEEGIGVSALQDRLGVQLSASPNHLLAKEHFVIEGDVASATSPVFDYDEMEVTLAAETDQRLQIEAKIPGAKPSDGVLEIEAPDAEMWVLKARTSLGPDPDDRTNLLLSPDHDVVLRNDAEKLWPLMAGAMSRYFDERARAEITIAGLKPWGGLVGNILTVIEQAGDRQTIEAPITSVDVIAGRGPEDAGATVIRTGFAR